MPEIIRHSPDGRRPDQCNPGMWDADLRCPDCGRDRLFGQHHGPADRCPDTADLYCPEWYCVYCGAALLVGDAPVAARWAGRAGIRDRVA